MKIDALLLKRIRESGLSVNKLAKKSGVPQPVLQRFIAGTRPHITIGTIQKLFDYFEIKVK